MVKQVTGACVSRLVKPCLNKKRLNHYTWYFDIGFAADKHIAGPMIMLFQWLSERVFHGYKKQIKLFTDDCFVPATGFCLI
jgi:hypothetical protein